MKFQGLDLLLRFMNGIKKDQQEKLPGNYHEGQKRSENCLQSKLRYYALFTIVWFSTNLGLQKLSTKNMMHVTSKSVIKAWNLNNWVDRWLVIFISLHSRLYIWNLQQLIGNGQTLRTWESLLFCTVKKMWTIADTEIFEWRCNVWPSLCYVLYIQLFLPHLIFTINEYDCFTHFIWAENFLFSTRQVTNTLKIKLQFIISDLVI